MRPLADTWVEIPGARSPGVTVAITGPRVRLTFGDTWAEIEVHPEMEREVQRLRALLATITARCDEWKPGTSEPDPVRPGKWREFNTLAHGNTIIHGIVALIKKGGDE